MKISIVIPNFNGNDLLYDSFTSITKALTHYLKSSGEKGEIIYVDDGSTDESVREIKELFSKHQSHEITNKLVIQEKNKGFSSTVNNGVSHAAGDIVILLNTDVRPELGFLKPLLTHFSDENVFAVGCMDKSIEGGQTILRGRGIGKWQRGFLQHSAGKLTEETTLWVSGGSGAFRKSIWDTLGGLNELYDPFYWEDIDLSYRAHKSGYSVIFEKESVVVHEHEKGAIKRTRTESEVRTIAYRNQIQFVWLNITDIPLLFSHILWLPYYFFKSLTSDRSFLAGYAEASKNRKKIMVYRSKMKKSFVKSDSKVLSLVTS